MSKVKPNLSPFPLQPASLTLFFFLSINSHFILRVALTTMDLFMMPVFLTNPTLYE